MYIFIYCTYRGDNWQQARERIAHAQSQVTIMGLLPNQQYDVRVYAMNANGRSEPNDLETMTSKYSIIPFD